MGFLSILGTPLGWIMRVIYDYVVHSYGWALILFIILTKVIILPLSIKQQKSTARMAAFQPKLQKIQKQFAKDKNRLNEETMKLYEEEGINPMSGCLPMAVQMILLFGIIDVIYNPLKHILAIPGDQITKAVEALGSAATSAPHLAIISNIQSGSTTFNNIFTADKLELIQNFDMNFLGINLGSIPSKVWGILILIPVLSFVTQIISTVISMKVQEKNGQKMQGMMKWTMLLMPLMSLWFAFTLPAGVGLYWTVSNVLLIVQTIVLAKLYPPEKVAQMTDKVTERNKAKMKKKREQMETYTKMQQQGVSPAKAAAIAKNSELELPENAKEKEIAKRRLAEARKKMAEKYGDDYREE